MRHLAAEPAEEKKKGNWTGRIVILILFLAALGTKPMYAHAHTDGYHLVNEEADAGAIILQGVVNVEKDDTPEVLQKRIMENVEWKLLPKAVSLFCQDKIEIVDGRAYVKE